MGSDTRVYDRHRDGNFASLREYASAFGSHATEPPVPWRTCKDCIPQEKSNRSVP